MNILAASHSNDDIATAKAYAAFFILALALALLCSACGEKENTNSPPSTSSIHTEENQDSQILNPDASTPEENPINMSHVTMDQFPIPTADTFGLSGEEADLYNVAVSLFSNLTMESAFKAEPIPATHLFIPALTLYGKYSTEDGNTVYVVAFLRRHYYEIGLGLQDLNNPVYNYGSSGSIAAFTLDADGTLVKFDEIGNGENIYEATERICGKLTDLADFLCDRTDSYSVEPIDIPLMDRDEMLKQYLNCYFAG